MKEIKIWNDNPSEKQIDEIVSALEEGEIWIIPTDSIYGIMCNALNQKAVEKVCRLKGLNPERNNLSVICHDISMASQYAKLSDSTFTLMRDNTPGPFTFICRAQNNLPKEFKKRKTVGIRIPRCETTLRIAERLSNPLLTTSIEFEDDDYAMNPELIKEAYEGRTDGIVIGEEGGISPTAIIDCMESSPSILREGLEELHD